MARIAKYAGWTIYLFLLCLHIFLLINGASGYITGLLILPAVFWLGDALLGRLRPAWKKSGWRVSFWSALVALLLLETVLRFGVRKHLAYAELNGNLYYSSPFLQHRIDGILRRSLEGEEDTRLRLGPRNQTVVDSKPEFTFTYSYNSLGLRDREYPTDSLKDKKVILCLGDSFCEGVGAPPGKSWPHQLGKRLQQSDSSVVVVNAGIQGSDVFFELYKLEHVLYDAYRPQTVILSVNSTDIHDVAIRRGAERFDGSAGLRYRSPPWWEYLYGFSMITRYLVHDVFNVGPDLITPKQLADRNRQAVQSIGDALAGDFADFARENRIEPLVVFHPMYYEIGDGLNPFADCMSLLESSGVPYLDLYAAVRGLPDTALADIHWPVDMHYNEKGYDLMAGFIYGHFRETRDSLP